MERMIPHLLSSAVLGAIILFGITRRRWRLRQPPGTILRWERPTFKNVFGWVVIADGALMLLMYLVNRNDIRWPVFSVGTVILGSMMLRSPAYSELSEAQKSDALKLWNVALAIMGAYALARFLVGVLAPEQALIGFDLAFFCAALLWGVWSFRRFRRI